MPKLDIDKIKRKGIVIFHTKAEMLEYIKKASFRKDKWGYGHYTMEIDYYKRKWFVRWI